MNYDSKNSKKIATGFLFLILSISLSPMFGIKAEAQWVVWDPGNFVPNTVTAVNSTISASSDVAAITKDFGLDAVGWIIVNLIIERMSASTVNWINRGFQGKPAFVTDPEAFFGGLADKIAGQFIFSNPDLNFLCSPIRAKIRLALANNYNRDNQRWQCTLTKVGKNMDNFMDNFENGGWENFFELTQKKQNNPIGAYLQAEGELLQKITRRTEEKNNQLNWGRGFLSFEVCGEEGRDTDGTCIGKATISTPGGVISEQLNKQLGLGGDKLAVADEINELLSALLNQLIGKVIGGIGAGIRSLSSPDSSNNNQTFTSLLTSPENDKTIVDYYQTSSSTINNTLNTPPPNLNYDLNSGRPKNDVGYPADWNCAPGDLTCQAQ